MAVQKCNSCEQLGKTHEYQDSKYGKWQRVMCPCKGGDKMRCTICSQESDKKGN